MRDSFAAELIRLIEEDESIMLLTGDLGFGVLLKKQKLRLLYVDAPEIRGESRQDGLVSRDQLRNRILDKNVKIKTHKDTKGKYGRWLVEIWDGSDESVNGWLITEGFADKYDK